MIFIDKEHNKCQIIDFGIPYDTRVDDKEVKTIEKYLDLARELKKVWNMKVKVVPLVVAALGTPANALEKILKNICIETKITELKKTALIHSSRILRKVLELSGVLLTLYLKNKSYPLLEINVRLFKINNNNNKSNINNNNDNENNNYLKINNNNTSNIVIASIIIIINFQIIFILKVL